MKLVAMKKIWQPIFVIIKNFCNFALLKLVK